jgi:hypothetical protein
MWVREAPGPIWQHPEEADDAGQLHTRRWAGVGAELGWPRKSIPRRFSQFKSFFQLNKSARENKNTKNSWRPQKNVKFCIEIDLNICHNFCIDSLTKGQPYSNEKYISV